MNVLLCGDPDSPFLPEGADVVVHKGDVRLLSYGCTFDGIIAHKIGDADLQRILGSFFAHTKLGSLLFVSSENNPERLEVLIKQSGFRTVERWSKDACVGFLARRDI